MGRLSQRFAAAVTGPKGGQYVVTASGKKEYRKPGGAVPPSGTGSLQKHVGESLKSGGGTLTVQTGKKVTKGFAVSTEKGLETKIPAKEITRQHVADFIAKNAETLKKPGAKLGIWRDKKSGMVFLDVATVVKSLDEAKSLGKQHSQLAVYDLGGQHEVRLDEGGGGPPA